jgi:predicted GNAT family N-acyltransferase
MVSEKFSLGLDPDAKLIRQEVFCDEQGYKNEFTGDDEGCWCLVLYLDGTPIATGRIQEVDPETYRIGRVAVRKPYRGRKVGTYLVKFLEVKIKTLGGRKVVLHSQLEKKGFYETLGYKVSGEGLIDYEEGHPHVMMEKALKFKKLRKRPTD